LLWPSTSRESSHACAPRVTAIPLRQKGWRQMATKPSKPKSKGTGKAKPAAGSKKKSK
jgi:hypothetical protein